MFKALIEKIKNLFNKPEEEVVFFIDPKAKDAWPFPVEKPKRKPRVKKATTRPAKKPATKKPAVKKTADKKPVTKAKKK